MVVCLEVSKDFAYYLLGRKEEGASELYAIYDDGSESLIETKEQIDEHNGLFMQEVHIG